MQANRMSVRLRFLAVFLLLISCCGDFTLFPYGGGGEEPEFPEVLPGCEKVFAGLGDYAGLAEQIGDPFENSADNNRISLAVVPAGMTFTYTDNGTKTAAAGDVILADEGGNSIYVYDYSSSERYVLLSDDEYSGVTGLVLLQAEIDEVNYSFLFFTIRSSAYLYIYDLKGVHIPAYSNPLPVETSHHKAVAPTSLALGVNGTQGVLFILDDNGSDSQIVRVFVDLSTFLVTSTSIASMGNASHQLFDMAYLQSQDYLFVSKRIRSNVTGNYGWVYRISSAADRTISQGLDDNGDAFASWDASNMTGVALAYEDTTSKTAALLVLLEREGNNQLLQYDTLTAGAPESQLTVVNDVGGFFSGLTTVQYDCSHERILLANVPFNTSSSKSFLQLLLSD